MIPLWLAAEVTNVLAEQGFVSGKYGDIPYVVKAWGSQDNAEMLRSIVVLHADVEIDERSIGHAEVFSDGTVDLQIDL